MAFTLSGKGSRILKALPLLILFCSARGKKERQGEQLVYYKNTVQRYWWLGLSGSWVVAEEVWECLDSGYIWKAKSNLRYQLWKWYCDVHLSYHCAWLSFASNDGDRYQFYFTLEFPQIAFCLFLTSNIINFRIKFKD